ncbi:MAG TPA: hypothetical protein VG796_19520 [Verrucomicrobiales bacterium]|nr:hypothetical protein [Verrucomicrobiales bacterium]
MNARLTIFLLALCCPRLFAAEPLPNTQPLTEQGDLAAKMVQGIHRFLDRETIEAAKARPALWKLDPASQESWEKSIEPKRARLRQMLGLIDERVPAHLRSPAVAPGETNEAATTGSSAIERVEWDVVRNVKSEGLLATVGKEGTLRIIVLPDIGTTPEQMFGLEPGIPPERQWALRCAGLPKASLVACPALLDRRKGAPMPVRPSALTQREVLWRAGFELGRTLTAYDLQSIFALIDGIQKTGGAGPIAIIGSGESGRLALLAAAIDSRISTVMIEGTLAPMENQWEEPIDRTVFGLVREFGTAELIAMIVPRRVISGPSGWPSLTITDEGGNAPGKLSEPPAAVQKAEADRADAMLPPFADGHDVKNRRALQLFEKPDDLFTGFSAVFGKPAAPSSPPEKIQAIDQNARQTRLFKGILEDTQVLMRKAQATRGAYWKEANFSSAENFEKSAKSYRERFWTDVTGKLPPATLPPNAKSRPIYETDKFTGWEVTLDVYPDVFSFGILLLPKDLKPGDKRAVIVCQHGLEGRPSDVADPKQDNPAYHAYAARLAEKGYIVFAPQNPYIGKTEFRQLCRKAWPLGLSLWSFIVRQHETILTWLKTLPNVDPARIAFYGLSYGGKSAMRLPALLTDYCLSICSADYNEWIWKNVDASSPMCYLYNQEFDMVEWNLANTFNYAELSWLIFPRPFMVERGHDDGVGSDEWVSYEFARTFRHYSRQGLRDRAEIEFFNGPHTINGKGTFRFLDKWLAK